MLAAKGETPSHDCKNYDVSYVGETGRKFGKRLDEHRKEAAKR